MKELLAGPFPPDTLPGELSDDERAECVRRAKGKPGQTVEPGLFPRAEAKVARLLLAAAGYWEPNELLALAYACDSSERSHFKKSYHAHDAFACALVHPRISPEERARLITVVLAPDKSLRVGWRSRKKSWALARWAVARGFIEPTLLTPVLRHELVAPVAEPSPEKTAWTSRDFIDALIDCRLKWRARRGRIHAEHLYYVAIADLGRELFAALLGGCKAPWTEHVFQVIEQVFEKGDAEAQNLCVVGLFESLQGQSHGQGPADLIERRLGPRALAAWGDLIEGWTGQGIRSVQQWRAKPRE
ncbi:DUF7674 family protein [Hyalangium gracile]|uniref:DUF7674 family protein n=1 Tax=Hyalangium gracile TaxID=394092 RepID=UPI001CCA4E72|nr:hypothetical protein [Hyalangium gracile]